MKYTLGIYDAEKNEYYESNLWLYFVTGLTPLHVVAIVGNVNIFKIIMENTEDIQPKNASDSRTPYHFAAEMGQFGYNSAHS